MKVWLKLLIGSILGVSLGFLLPHDHQTVLGVLAWLEKLAIQIGRYAMVPTLVFGLMIAVFELRQDRQLWGLVFKTSGLLVAGSILIIGSGIIITIAFPPARIPILIEGQKESLSLEIGRGMLELFPSNMLSALISDGAYLLPAVVFAFFMGGGLSYDRTYSKAVTGLIDSFSRVFYYIASFFSEILGLVIILLGAYWAVRFHGALQADVFQDILRLLGIYALVLGFGIFPLFLYLLGPKTNPWKQLYGALGPALAGFCSGDMHFTLPVLIRHAKDSHGVRRRSNALTLSLFGVFGRAGSAMVAAISLIVIIKSYSSLGVTAADLASIFIRAVFISFLLARHPGDGAYAALAVLCADFGRGFEAGYLILKPIAFYLVAIGTLIDVLFASLATYAIARLSGFQEDKEARHFI
jgi:Na+/H+-dicarboxylate symporter